MITLSTTSLACQSKTRCHFAIDIQLQAGIVEILRNQYIAYVRHSTQLCRHLTGDLVSRMLIVAADLNIDGRGHALVHDRIHQAACLEIGESSGSPTQLPPHAIHVGEAAELVLLLSG